MLFKLGYMYKVGYVVLISICKPLICNQRLVTSGAQNGVLGMPSPLRTK